MAQMTKPLGGSLFRRSGLIAALCAVLLLTGDVLILAQTEPAQPPAEEPAKIPPDQLDALVAPIALYPDPLLSQTLVASTYPLEIIQLQQWLEKNKDLKEQALEEAVKKQDWDPSIQAMALLPDVVKRLADDIKWTTDLGNAFLAQQADVMDAVQRMRKKAQAQGNLKSTEQQKVETQTVETKTVIVIQQADPQIVYVPAYNPVVVYGPPVYPYPPIYYPPPPPPGYYAGAAIAFGIGIAIGSSWHGGWGYHCGWGHNDITINVNNNFVSHYNRNNVNRIQGGGGSNWQHNPQHRGGAPYANQTTANKFGGTTRGGSASTRQAGAGQQVSRGGTGPQAGAVNRGAGGGSGSTLGGGGGGGDRIGSQNVSRPSSASKDSSAFGGASSGMRGSSTRTSSARGSSSMGGMRGGGGGGRRR